MNEMAREDKERRSKGIKQDRKRKNIRTREEGKGLRGKER